MLPAAPSVDQLTTIEGSRIRILIYLELLFGSKLRVNGELLYVSEHKSGVLDPEELFLNETLPLQPVVWLKQIDRPKFCLVHSWHSDERTPRKEWSGEFLSPWVNTPLWLDKNFMRFAAGTAAVTRSSR